MDNQEVPPGDSGGPSTSQMASEYAQPDTNVFPYCYPIWDPKNSLYGYITVDGNLPQNPVFPGIPFVEVPILGKECITAICSDSENSNPSTSSKEATGNVDEDTVVCFGENLHAIRALYNAMSANCNTTHQLHVTLEEIYNGCTKMVKVIRVVADSNGKAQIAVKTLLVAIKPGCEDGNRIAFVRQGNQLPGRSAASVIFEIKEKPHAVFKREGINLRCTYKLSLKKALGGGVIYVPLLNGTKRQIVITPATSVGSIIRLCNGGMPNLRDPNGFGDLFVNLDIVFPASLTLEQKGVATLLTDQSPRPILNRQVASTDIIEIVSAGSVPGETPLVNSPLVEPSNETIHEPSPTVSKYALKRRAPSPDISVNVSTGSVTARPASRNLQTQEPPYKSRCVLTLSSPKCTLKRRAPSKDFGKDVTASDVSSKQATVDGLQQKPALRTGCVTTVNNKRALVSEEGGPSTSFIMAAPKRDLTKLNMSFSQRFSLGFNRLSFPKLVSRGTGNLSTARNYLSRTLQDGPDVAKRSSGSLVTKSSTSCSKADENNLDNGEVEMAYFGWLGFLEPSDTHATTEKPPAPSIVMMKAKRAEEKHRAKQMEACLLAKNMTLSTFQLELLRYLEEPDGAGLFPEPQEGYVTVVTRTLLFGYLRWCDVHSLRKHLFPVLPFGIKTSPMGLIVEFSSPFLARFMFNLLDQYAFQVNGRSALACMYGFGIYWCPAEHTYLIPFRRIKASDMYTVTAKGMVDWTSLPLNLVKDYSLAEASSTSGHSADQQI